MASPTPFQDRGRLRLVLIREERLSDAARQQPAVTADEAFKFDRLAAYIRAADRDLPRCIHRREIAAEQIAAPGPIVRAFESFWSLASIDATFVMQTLDIPMEATVAETVDELQSMYEGMDFSFGRPPIFMPSSSTAPAKQHQFVFLPSSRGALSFDELQRYVYRANLEAVEERSVIQYPGELNRRPGIGAGCGPFVSVMWGQQDYIENCAVLSAMLALGAAMTVRDVQTQELRMFEVLGAAQSDVQAMPLAESRGFVNGMEEQLAALQTSLVLGLDSVATLMPLVPSLRPESFHRALFSATEVEANRARLERITARLTAVVGTQAGVVARLTASRAESRARRWSVTLSFVSLLAVPFGITFGFFGMSALEVDGRRSFMDVQFYWPIYAGIGILMVATVALHVFMLWNERRRQRRGAADAQRAGAV